MIKLFLISICTLFFYHVYSQNISGKIVDSLNIPIQYANIGVKYQNIGTVSDEKGDFSFDITNLMQDTKIIISNIAYRSKEYSLRDFLMEINGKKKIILEKKHYNIGEVNISTNRLKKDNLGNKTTSSVIEACFKNNSLGSEVGIKIKINNSPTYIDSFNFFITSCKYDSIFFRLNIYSIKNDMPNENILYQNIYFSTDIKKGKVSIDLSKYNIVVDDDVIIAIEYIKELGKGGLNFSGGLFGNKLYHRQTSFSEWKKTGVISLGFNVDVRD